MHIYIFYVYVCVCVSLTKNNVPLKNRPFATIIEHPVGIWSI